MSTGKFADYFAGRAITLPGVYTDTDASALVAPSGVPQRAMVIVDVARGGNVGLATRVPAAQVVPLLRGGHGAQLASIATNEGGLKEVFFVRVNAATAAALDVGDGTITHRNPGTGSRATKVERSANAARADAWDVRVTDTSGAFPPEAYLGLGPVLDVTYAGTGSAPTLAITAATGTTTFTFGATDDTDAVEVVTSDQAATAQLLADFLNGTPSWTAKVSGNPAFPLAQVPAQTVTFTASKGSVSGGFNTIAVALENSNIVAGTPKAGAARLTSGAEYLTGGSDGSAPTTNDWISALRVCENLPVINIVIGTGDPAVVAALESHVLRMSEVTAKRERIGWTGPGLQVSKAAFKSAAITLALQCDSSRMVVAGNEVITNDLLTRKLTRFDSTALAAFAAALKTAGRPEEPLTHKTVPMQLQYSYDPDADLVDLIEGGVMAAHYDTEAGRNLITQGLTTYTDDANVAYRKIAGQDTIDYLNKRLRVALEPFVGKVGDQTLAQQVVTKAAGVLNSEIRDTRNPRGVLIAGLDPETRAPVKAWDSLVAETNGFDVLGVTFNARIVGEIAKVFVTTTLKPVTLTASA